MFTTNPFAELSASLSPALMQTYVKQALTWFLQPAQRRTLA